MNFLRSPELDTAAGEAVFGLPVSYARWQERDVSGLPDLSGATHGLRRGRGIHRGDSRLSERVLARSSRGASAGACGPALAGASGR